MSSAAFASKRLWPDVAGPVNANCAAKRPMQMAARVELTNRVNAQSLLPHMLSLPVTRLRRLIGTQTLLKRASWRLRVAIRKCATVESCECARRRAKPCAGRQLAVADVPMDSRASTSQLIGRVRNYDSSPIDALSGVQ